MKLRRICTHHAPTPQENSCEVYAEMVDIKMLSKLLYQSNVQHCRIGQQ